LVRLATSLRKVRGVRPRVWSEPGAPAVPTYPDDDFLPTTHDLWTPNLTKTPDIFSAQSGNWSDGPTWDLGRAPQAGETVGVMTSHVVTYDADVTTAYRGVGVAGTLTFRTAADTQLWTQHLIVYPGGSLRVGTAGSPVQPGVTAEVVFTDVAIDTGEDPAQYGNGLVCQGDFQACGQAKSSGNLIRLAGAASAGATSLTLASAPSGWEVGDEVILPDSRLAIDPVTWSTAHPRFRTTIASVSGTSLGIADALDVARPTAVDHAGVAEADMTAHVGNLTRNVIFRSEDPSGVRGHVIFMGTAATADVRHCRFKGLGRTTGSVLDDTTFDGSGNATYVGTNQKGRYGPHFHHMDDTGFVITGCAIDPGTDGDHTSKWAITLHHSSNGTITENVLWNWVGSAFSIEDIECNDNVIDNNLAVYVMGGPGAGSRADTGFPGREGDGFWMNSGSNNRFRDNSAANCYLHGYTFFGNDPTMGPYLEFDGNETYGGRNGFTHWYINGADTASPDAGAATSYLDNMKIWHCWEHGYGIGYPVYNVTFRYWKVRLGTDVTRIGTGWFNGDYLQRGCRLVDMDIQNCNYGIENPIPDSDSTTFTVNGGTLYNDFNIRMRTSATPGSGGWVPQDRYCTYTDVDFAGYFAGGGHVYCGYSASVHKSHLREVDDVRIYNFTDDGLDYRVWYAEQASAQVMPQSTGGETIIEGCPEAGLTNAQAYVAYDQDGSAKVGGSLSDPTGCCIGGAIMPGGASTVAWVTGGKVTTL
jgi:hypothetical protein